MNYPKLFFNSSLPIPKRLQESVYTPSVFPIFLSIAFPSQKNLDQFIPFLKQSCETSKENNHEVFILVKSICIRTFFESHSSRKSIVVFNQRVIPLFLLLITSLYSYPFHIGFSIPETKIVSEIPKKDQDFAFLIPGKAETYIFDHEADYYRDYQRSYFAVTCIKAGWDCLRHYEILASGCIPYFVDLEKCDSDTMYFLPKDLILEAMNLKGVSYLKIDHAQFDEEKYYSILKQLLDHTRQYLTTKAMAAYLLKQLNYSGNGKILYLSENLEPDYLRCLTLIRLKENLGDKVIDYPKIEHIYKSYRKDVKSLYGKGFTYSCIVDDIPMSRYSIPYRIMRKEFELIIYGSVHRGLPFHDLVLKAYRPNQIAYLCGNDFHQCDCASLTNLFLREFSAIK
jgi:hypothetical protein